LEKGFSILNKYAMAEVVKDVVADLETGDVKKAAEDVKKAAEEVKDVVVSTAVTEVSGKTIGCDCGGWHLSLHMSQTSQTAPSPSKQVDSATKDSK